MRNSLLVALLFTTGCAHVSREEAMAVTAYDVMSDAEIAEAAVKEALGELHQVRAIDENGVVTSGRPAFESRDERLAFERRVDGLLRKKIYGQGPTLELVRIHCELQQKAGWASWPGDTAHVRNACSYGDSVVTLHSLFKKPMLQRAYVDALLAVADDPVLTWHAQRRMSDLERTGVEPYLFIVGNWERVEGFRPRG
ncbi:MAG: hypothetical protein DI536_26040 [Archangium gephyra]|uniref:Lipoprotein n=1 Tax=Archangium gephyra TaxID=48 RepID=A0A2W5UFV5_9BACT|nr:MAG: hypothetical protein DI536_26040 [Archangium gephyra]